MFYSLNSLNPNSMVLFVSKNRNKCLVKNQESSRCPLSIWLLSVIGTFCQLSTSNCQLSTSNKHSFGFFFWQCEDPRCHVWQHMGCVIIPDKPLEGNPPVPELFYCELCRLSRADPYVSPVFCCYKNFI